MFFFMIIETDRLDAAVLSIAIYLFSLCYLFMIIFRLSKDLMSAVFYSLVNTEIEPCCYVRDFSLNTLLKCRYSSCPFLNVYA